MDFQQEIQAKNIYMFDDFEYEDDVFYRELRQQVLQLTAEDDDEEELVYINKETKTMATNDHGSPLRGYYDWPREKEAVVTPASIMNLWRTGNGTGVFIPQIVQAKKKNRSRRRRNERGRAHRHVEKI